MKTAKFFFLGVVAAVTLNFNHSMQAAEANDQLTLVKQNQALMNSPRMRELYPELTRGIPSSVTAVSTPNHCNEQLAKISSNAALVHSPRIIEQYPQLARARQTETTSSTDTRLAVIRQNAALSHSPRMLEQYPSLARQPEPLQVEMQSANIAPLK